MLLSSKPSLHANVDCNAIVAAVVSRQVAVVHLLLKVTFSSLSFGLSLKRISMIHKRFKFGGFYSSLSIFYLFIKIKAR